MPAIAPNSPEALKKAEKIRNIFFLIAAANLVFVAIVIWTESKKPKQAKPESPPTTEQPAVP